MPISKVKWFSNAKGFGFIETEVGDAFIHHSEIAAEGFRQLRGGQLVEFELTESPRGLVAQNVRVVEESE